MEAAGRDGGQGPSWSYRRRRDETESSCYTISSSSRSGTIVSSTAYTSGASRHSSTFSAEVALLQLELQNDQEDIESAPRVRKLGGSTPTSGLCHSTVCAVSPFVQDAETCQPIKKTRIEIEEMLERMKHIKILVQEFFGAPSANRSKEGDDMNVLERWFTELDVSWVLQLDVGASALVLRHPTVSETWSWIRAFTQIMETIHLTESFFPDHGHGFVGMPAITNTSEGEVERGEQATTSLEPVQFALYFQKAMTKMLVLVDVLFSKSLSIHGPEDRAKSVNSYLDIYGALSGIRLQFHYWPPSAEVEKIEKEMVNLLSAKQSQAFEAIWSTFEEIRTHALKSLEDYSLGTQTTQESSDIHKATYLVMDHIHLLLDNPSTVSPLVSQAASLGMYVHRTGLEEAPPVVSVIVDMVLCLREKLTTKSQLILDQGLRFLFLLNNSNFIRELLQNSPLCIEVDVETDTRKDELGHYIESYIQVSWAPMLSCLSNHTPLCLGRNYSPLSKFESEFQKIYTTQKFWKVPDPGLRNKLRRAIIDKIIPSYTKYIKDSKVTNPKFTPQELQDMLQELFEG